MKFYAAVCSDASKTSFGWNAESWIMLIQDPQNAQGVLIGRD